MPVMEKTDVAWHRDIHDAGRDVQHEIALLNHLKKEYKSYREAFPNFELALNDAYSKNRSSSYAKAHDFQNIVGSFIQRLANALPNDVSSINRIVLDFERTWNGVMPVHFNKIFVQKRKFLIGPLSISRTVDSATHFNWILDQVKSLRKVWARLDVYIEQAVRELQQ